MGDAGEQTARSAWGGTRTQNRDTTAATQVTGTPSSPWFKATLTQQHEKIRAPKGETDLMVS